MEVTAQMKALEQMQKRYGQTAFTEDHEFYRRVGFKSGSQTLSSIGETWQEAMSNLARKVDDAKAA